MSFRSDGIGRLVPRPDARALGLCIVQTTLPLLLTAALAGRAGKAADSCTWTRIGSLEIRRDKMSLWLLDKLFTSSLILLASRPRL